MSTKQVLVSLAFALVFSACREKVIAPEEVQLGQAYFPLELGSEWEFQVREVRWRLDEVDTSFRTVNWLLYDTSTSAAGEPLFILQERFRRPNRSNWSDTVRAIALERNSKELIWIENNVPYLRLVFPVENEKEWEYNKYNNVDFNPQFGFKEKQTSSYLDLRKPFAVGDTVYANTVRVRRDSISNLLENVNNFEVYAEGTGLVYSYRLDQQFEQNSTSGNFEIVEGFEITTTLTSFRP